MKGTRRERPLKVDFRASRRRPVEAGALLQSSLVRSCLSYCAVMKSLTSSSSEEIRLPKCVAAGSRKKSLRAPSSRLASLSSLPRESSTLSAAGR